MSGLNPITCPPGSPEFNLNSDSSSSIAIREPESQLENSEEVRALVRTLTRRSTFHPDVSNNPFSPQKDSVLDPNSSHFQPRVWTKAALHYHSRDPEAYPSRTAGIAFRDLSVHGYGKATDYQKSVGNVWLEALGMARSLVRSGGQRKIDILQKFDGLVENGEMLIVLGPPSSGCSTLLKTIAGETHGIYVDENSHLNYQGISANDMKFQFRGEAIYTAEIDVHFPMMTVGDTLSFAARARAPRHIPGGVDKLTYTTHMRDIVMAVFGISHTVNTKVGNDFIRGVSGGERKRVSIAEAVLSGSPLQCWDNSTRGLDSANAVEFCKNLRLATDLQGATACVAIYQAPQAAYDLFHKVVVLYEGRQIYFGRTRDAKKYFEDLGFVCPDRQTDGDFLTSMTSPEERVIRPGWENMAPRTSDEFATVWKNSDKRKALLEQIEAYNHKYPIGGEHLEKFKESRRAQQSKRQSMKSPYTLDYQQQIKLTLWRSFKRLVADPSLTLTQLFGNMLMAIVIGSVFLNLKATTENFFPRGALLFFSVLINAFGSVLEVLTLYAQRPIVEKHSRYALYHPSAEAWASMLMDLPYKILNTFTFNIPLYFMTNLRREAGAFFFFIFISFLITLAMSMTFRTIGAASRSLAQAMVPSAVVILGIMIYAGFALPKAYILGWSKWIFWINPLSYGFEALMVNEFHGRTFACWAYVPSGRLYDAVTGTQKVCSAVGSKPGLDFVLGADYLQMAYEYDIKNKWRNVGVLLAFIFFYCTTYVLATEFISEQKSKGEVLIFRRGISAGSQTAKTDEESGQSSPALVKKSVSNKKEFKGIEKQSAIFHWEDVCYDVKIKSETRRILDHVDGWVKPGTLTALMGVSGAGKTTLLDVLASRVTMGVISGGMFVNGQQRDESFQRKTGYVQQQDLHMATSTVREALEFSALLRQPAHIPREEKIRYIDEVISLLDMEGYAEAIVGVPGEGLNVEQRKRLTIGVELAAKPQLLLFLDEPTSGLDSQTSWSICDLMEKLTRNGQAILCTIHQPSAMLFQRFDRLLFLAKGGKTVYYGDIGQNAKVLTSYFERNGATPCPPAANPAEWMLDIIGAAPGCSTDIDWTKIWGESAEYAATKTELRRMKEELPRTDALLSNDAAYHREFAASFATQFWIVTQRVFTHYWRNPTYIYSKMALSLASALFIGFSFFKAKNSIQGLRNQMLSIFMIMSIFGQLVEQTMPAFVVQRALYESRERPAKAYSWKAFIMSSILVEIPWAIITSVLVYVAWYYPVGLYRNASPTHEEELRGALIFLLIVTYLIFTSTFSTLVIAVIGNAETGANIANLMFMMCLGFCGILITKDKIGDFWIFMYRVSPFTYLVSGMLSTAVANTNVTCAANEILTMQPPSGSTCAQYLNDYVAEAGGYIINGNATVGCHFCPMRTTNEFLRSVSAPYSEAWRNFGLMWVYIGFNIIGALVLYWIFRVPKKIHSEKEKKE
ncbi:putative multidrug resistance ABC transporter [Cadophora sp. DSE1049]|nr:putative multidrug resistance ABC transporter [Cadophora sp. DSE1049]